MLLSAGSVERGRTVFDGVLAHHPKRLDLWGIYLDMETRTGTRKQLDASLVRPDSTQVALPTTARLTT